MLEIRLKVFAYLKDALGFSEKSIEIEQGATVSDLWDKVSQDIDCAGTVVLFAVNEQFVEASHILKPDDVVAFMPPVSGG